MLMCKCMHDCMCHQAFGDATILPIRSPGICVGVKNMVARITHEARMHMRSCTNTPRAPACGLESVVRQQRLRGCTDLNAAVGACGLHATGSVPVCICAVAAKFRDVCNSRCDLAGCVEEHNNRPKSTVDTVAMAACPQTRLSQVSLINASTAHEHL